MRLIVGDETGLHKRVQVEGEHITVAGVQTRARGIKAICWASPSYDRFCLARADGVVSIWSDSKEGMKSLGEVKDVAGTETVGMGYVESAESVVVCHTTGKVKVGRLGEASSLPDHFPVTGPVSAMALNQEGGTSPQLAVGGKENDLQLYDVTQGASSFKAKNVPRDNLDLRVPIWISAIQYLTPHTLVTGTAYKQVRFYDIRASPRPLKSMELDDYRVNALTAHPSSIYEVVVGDVAGTVQLVDLKKMKVCGRFVGPAGSIRDMATHPTQPLLAVVGLDRMLRVFDLKTRQQRAMFYLKQRLTAVAFSSDLAKQESMREEDMEEVEDDLESLEDSDSEEGGGQGPVKGKGQGPSKGKIRYERLREEGDEGSQGEEEEEDEEEVAPFGRRGRPRDQIELHITGEGEGGGEEEEEEEEEDSEDDDGVEEEEEDDDESEGEEDFMAGLKGGEMDDEDDMEEVDDDEEEEEDDDEEEEEEEEVEEEEEEEEVKKPPVGKSRKPVQAKKSAPTNQSKRGGGGGGGAGGGKAAKRVRR